MGPETSKPPSPKRDYNQAILVKLIIRQRRFLTLLVVILCLLAFKQAASAQTAQLTGIITDTKSSLIAGAMVTLTNLDTGVARKAVTNTEGHYSIPFVQPGNYRLHVFSSGFKPVTGDKVRINVDQLCALISRSGLLLEPLQSFLIPGEEVRQELQCHLAVQVSRGVNPVKGLLTS